MSLEDNIQYITKILNDDGLLLCPSNNFWIACCHIDSIVAKERLIKLRNKAYISSFHVVASNIQMIKKIIPTVHPRIETLLAYHQKPLLINYPETIESSFSLIEDSWRLGLPIKLVANTFCSEIMQHLASPLLAAYAYDKIGNNCVDAATINRPLKDSADYITLDIYGDDQMDIEDVQASYDTEGNLIFQ